jgi:uncharacterized protein (TIGR03084 family)
MELQLAEIINDLTAEQHALEAVMELLTANEWDTQSHAPGWLVRDQATHLAWLDEYASRALQDPVGFEEDGKRQAASAKGILEGDPEHYLMNARALPHGQLLDWWRAASSNLIEAAKALDSQVRIPWGGRKMSANSFLTARLMETWSHGLDIVDVVSQSRPDTDRLRHVAFIGVRTRRFSYLNRKLEFDSRPVRVSLNAPSGAVWEMGEQSDRDVIKGSATDFCRVVTQRRHLADTNLEVIGDTARQWLGIAQAFAGPPGQGRQPGEFARDGAPD